MPHTSDSITYLPLPSWLEASVEEAISATSNTVVSDSQRWAFEFELPVNEGVKRVVDQTKKVYLEKSSSEVSFLSSHGAVFKGSWRSGGLVDTIIIPLMGYGAEVTARNEGGKEIKVDWNWKNAILVSKHTVFRIEGETKIGAVIITLRR
ncbi:hypothetical protein I7I53_07021 [Histoplasma capsulatum var. duboisii H88]|uniref:Uncharacterized protein n=1 Tax=Ajellomyces capsulatus (strain H88) TaxID=544711 RepID=A0A8A1LDK2_AJEC8|nr:hypothetical protein I7I53_07021 [Histoplasma capsulatum var. duboisii H88]